VAIHWTTPVWLWPLLLIVATGAVLWTIRAYRQTRPAVSTRLTRLLSGLRMAALLLLVLAVAGPVLSRLQVSMRPAEVAVILEDSGSMRIRDAGGDTLRDRWSAGLAVAASVDSVLGAERQSVRPVFLRGNGLLPVSEFRLGDPVIGAPAGHGTNLGDLCRQAADRLAGRPVRAIVIVSDGQETAAGWRARDRRVRRTPQPAETLFVVGVGDAAGPPDRVLRDLRYPDSAYVGDEVEVAFAVDHRYLGSEGGDDRSRRITARLTGPEGLVAEETVTSAEKLVPFVMNFSPHGEGLRSYELSVDVLDNERFPANNKASLAIHVRRERARVLLLSNRPSWDVRFLAQAAVQEQRVALAVVHPTIDGLVFADSLTPWVEPSDVAGWMTWDAVVLTGWTGSLASLDWTVLGQAVEQGLGLMVTAGSSSGPGGGPVPLAPPATLASFLPVRIAAWRWFQGPFFVRVPGAALGHPILGGVGTETGDDAGSVGAWAALPPLDQVVAVSAGPGAEVLLNGEARQGGGTAPARCLLAVAGRGQGRVVWFGGRSLWELAFWEQGREMSDTVTKGHIGRLLARNMLVWTAEGNTESGLEFTGRQTFFQAGEPIRLGARWRDMRGQPVSDRALSLVLRGGAAAADSLRERTYGLHRSEDSPGQAEVELPPLAAGRYSVQLIGAGEPPVLGRREDLIVADNNIEMTQVRMDRRRLTQLAARGGGKFYDAGDPGDRRALWADLAAVAWHGDQVEKRHRWDIRAGWSLLLVVVVLLGVEWYLRRRHGLL